MRMEIAARQKFRAILASSLAIAVLVVSAPCSQVNAQLTGATVNVSAYHPDSTTLFENPGDRVVSDAIEYPAGSFALYSDLWEANINQSQIIIHWTPDFSGDFDNTEFNGFIFNVLSGPEILGATVNAASGFSPVAVTLDGSSRLLLNYKAVQVPPGPTFSIIDLQFVPEPTVFVLLTTAGLAILGLRRR